MISDSATLFSGFGGADLGLAMAGIKPIWGIEYDQKIQSVAVQNRLPILHRDVITMDYTSLQTPGWLHMSPPCVRASVAACGQDESSLDLMIADGCIRAIQELRPPWISLENVYGYETFESFRKIVIALRSEGYAVEWWRLNSADYGVPQTRKRLILLASRVSRPIKPAATHIRRHESEQLSMFPLPKWANWFDAIYDLIPTLTKTNPADWQIRKLKGTRYDTSMIIDSRQGSEDFGSRPRSKDDPIFTISAGQHMPIAFICNGTTNNNGQKLTVLNHDQPVFTVTKSTTTKQIINKWHGQWLRCSTRCIARFQTFPDSYQLPQLNKLAATGIGNAVPPIFMREIIRNQGVNL